MIKQNLVKRAWIGALAAGLFLALCPGPAHSAPENAKAARTLMFYWENDTFAGTDKSYTNAFKLTWVSEDMDTYEQARLLPRWAVAAAGAMPLVNRPGFIQNVSFSFGQSIYTPENTDAEYLVEDDRPYAGLLYLSVGFHAKNQRLLDTLELTLGIVGPASLAEDTQKGVHDLIGSSEPKGWDHQLENEPGLAITWQRSLRIASGAESGFGWDLIPHGGVTLGNIQTYVNAGAGFRFGWRLPSDFGTSLIRPAGNISAPSANADARLSEKKDFGAYAFVRAEGRAVAWNIFLDGNTWRDSHSVDKKYFVADLSTGVALTYKSLTVSYTHSYRTREFDEQGDGLLFGSVSLSWIY